MPPLLTALVPADVGPLYRLSVLWATLPGGALTAGAAWLVSAALAPAAGVGWRRTGALCAGGTLALAVAAWFAPDGLGAAPSSLPTYVQSPAAAAAPLLALAALIGLGWIVSGFAARNAFPKAVAIGTWVAATAAVGAEQLARSQLGIGPRDGVVFGAAASGLVLWLLASALLHRRVQSALSPGGGGATAVSTRRAGGLLAHAGAACLAASFGAHVVASRASVALPPGQGVEVRGSFGGTWRLVNQGVSRFDAEGVDVTALAVEVTTPGGATRLVSTDLRDWHARDGTHLEPPVGRRRAVRSVAEEFRVLLERTDSVDVASVRVTFLPAPLLWPAGLLLLAASALTLAAVRRDSSAS